MEHMRITEGHHCSVNLLYSFEKSDGGLSLIETLTGFSITSTNRQSPSFLIFTTTSISFSPNSFSFTMTYLQGSWNFGSSGTGISAAYPNLSSTSFFVMSFTISAICFAAQNWLDSLTIFCTAPLL